MTELSYSISDLQTRIFGGHPQVCRRLLPSLIMDTKIQELRHQDFGTSIVNCASSSTSLSHVIDQALLGLDERIEAIARGIQAVNSLTDVGRFGDKSDESSAPGCKLSDEDDVLRQKQATLNAEWASVQADVMNLHDELKEDKWLAVFRNASDQADGMMTSLGKVVNQCDVSVVT